MIRLDDSAERINYPFQKIEDDTIIVDPKNRLMHQLNDVGSRVWELLSQRQAIRDIITTITDEYNVDPSAASEDVIQLLDKMSELKLIKVTNE
ncbi:MAG: PqqD family protein [Planctomycetes bacterium]|nr:PqqD family protein [Planctomycetota bacterium]